MEVKNICVLGIGNIGYEIGQQAAQAGYNVCLRDVSNEILQNGALKIKGALKKFFVDKGKMTQEEADKVFARIRFTTDLKDAVKDADVVIEAIPENMTLKKQVFKELDEICPSHTILASNTSSLSITEIGSLAKRQDKIIGMHFAKPVAILTYLEEIRGFNTSQETVDTIKDLAIKLGRDVSILKDAPGHSGRLLAVQVNEAVRMIADGICTADDIDKATRSALGHRMGLAEVADVNLELTYKVLEYLRQEYGEKYAPHPLMKKLVLAGKKLHDYK